MSDKKLSVKRVRKEKIVAQLSEKANRAKGFVFTNYQGLTHKQLETLKKAVKSQNADFVATKNTLLKLSLDQTQKSKLKNQISELRDSTATLFLYGDPVAPLKELAKMIKELNLPIIKFGILDGKEISDKDVMKLSTLPTREVLLTQLVLGLKSPIFGLHRALNWNLQKLVMTLSAIKQKKS